MGGDLRLKGNLKRPGLNQASSVITAFERCTAETAIEVIRLRGRLGSRRQPGRGCHRCTYALSLEPSQYTELLWKRHTTRDKTQTKRDSIGGQLPGLYEGHLCNPKPRDRPVRVAVLFL